MSIAGSSTSYTISARPEASRTIVAETGVALCKGSDVNITSASSSPPSRRSSSTYSSRDEDLEGLPLLNRARVATGRGRATRRAAWWPAGRAETADAAIEAITGGRDDERGEECTRDVGRDRKFLLLCRTSRG